MPDDNPPQLIRYLTGRQLAQRLNLSSTRVQDLIGKGLLQPDARAGDMTLFQSERIEALADIVEKNRANNWRHCTP